MAPIPGLPGLVTYGGSCWVCRWRNRDAVHPAKLRTISHPVESIKGAALCSVRLPFPTVELSSAGQSVMPAGRRRSMAPYPRVASPLKPILACPSWHTLSRVVKPLPWKMMPPIRLSDAFCCPPPVSQSTPPCQNAALPHPGSRTPISHLPPSPPSHPSHPLSKSKGGVSRDRGGRATGSAWPALRLNRPAGLPKISLRRGEW